MVKGRRLWCKLSTPVGEVRAYVCREVVHADGEVCKAQYISGSHTIEVEYNENIDVMKKNLFHEMIHNCYDGIGSVTWSKMFGAVTEEVAWKREEETATFLEDKLYDLLSRNRMLRFPKPPKMGA